jgi:hypothetical protein
MATFLVIQPRGNRPIFVLTQISFLARTPGSVFRFGVAEQAALIARYSASCSIGLFSLLALCENCGETNPLKRIELLQKIAKQTAAGKLKGDCFNNSTLKRLFFGLGSR